MSENERYKRIFVVVLDSFGMGEMPDASEYGDAGADTFGHILRGYSDLNIPNMKRLGFLNLKETQYAEGVVTPTGKYAMLCERSNGKDTLTGHWEMMGVYTEHPFKTFPKGFPGELIEALEERFGREVIGNKPESGTVILEELGEEEINNGKVIVYTSADSVLQICGNEDKMGLDTLYDYCEFARELTMREDWKVGRVIARPYVGERKGEFKRTSNRRDYSLKPSNKTAMDVMKENGFDVIGIGKIHDIFAGEGITEPMHSDSSVHGMEQTIEVAGRDFEGMCYVNLCDFDVLWGHRRDVEGYARELERFDRKLGELMEALGEDDLLVLTADHGNDPTFTGTNHTREKVPFVAYSPRFAEGGNIDEQDTFAVIGATVLDNFGLDVPEGAIGESILERLS